jgi:hypothetical protein
VLSGLDSLEPVLWELTFATRLDFRTGERFRTRVELATRPTFGVGDNQFLDGIRSDGFVAERVRFGRVELGADLRLRWLRAGEQRFTLDPDAYAICEPECGDYRIPFSYWAPGVGLDVGVEPLDGLRLNAGARIEQRRYLEPSGIVGFSQTEKRRRDLRYRARAGLELELDREGTFLAGLDYTHLRSRSNIALDPEDPEHAWDYSDRNFSQNILELGLQASF